MLVSLLNGSSFLEAFPALKKPETGRIYLFLGFGGTTAVYSPAILRFCKNGFSVVAFQFNIRRIRDLNMQTLPIGIDDICKTVQAYEAKRNDRLPAISIGSSMGSVFAWHAAQRVPTISVVVANTGYALISKMAFEWESKHNKYRKQLLAEGYTQETYHQAILDSEPVTRFDKLKGKRVLLFMNRDDNVINFEHAQIFKDALERNGIDYTYVETNEKTHGRSVAKNLFSKKLLEFLRG